MSQSDDDDDDDEPKCIECGCRFEPLVVEDQGRLGDRSRIITNELI